MRIIIGLIEHIGDIIACEPVSRYVRDQYPDAHISWAVLGHYREIIDINPWVDETVPLECLTDWIRLTKHEDYDEVIDLHVNYRVCQHCLVPLIKERGNPFVNAFEWFDYGAILEAFSIGAGLPKISAQPEVYLGPEHTGAVDALGLPNTFCVIHRESNDLDKDWPDDNWRALTSWITTELGLPIVEVGANKTYQASPLGDSVIDLINRTPILQTAEVIRRARFFIGIDSGPAHMANAVQTPGLVMLGRYNVFRQYTPFTGFYASDRPEVKLVRNPTGPTSEIPVSNVVEALRYLENILQERDRSPERAARSGDVDGIPVSESDRATVRESGMFDRSWYVVHYPDVLASRIDPLDHFVAYGGHLGYSPGPEFNSAYYLKRHADVARAGMNPLLHYLWAGRGEGREIKPFVPRRPVPENLSASALGRTRFLSSAYTDNDAAVDDAASNVIEEMPRTFAFYLPQFHPIQENNFGHRMGFTEWDNVINAKPLFKGHYQPRTPGELGYYDLRSIEVMREQIRLANDHGITGFCFYYYYFNGTRLLYKPIENYLNSDIKAPFFFLWANENWSRRWDGGDNEVIIDQQHSREDDLVFIRSLVEVFADDRYVKINGKPILMVYKTHLFPDIKETAELWRSEIVHHGFPGLYLVMVDDWTSDPPHPRSLGFDATYEIPSNVVHQSVLSDETDTLGLRKNFRGRIVDYRKFSEYHMSRPFPEHKRFRTVMLPWDNTPRYAMDAMVHVNTGGDGYQTWLTQALLDTQHRYPPEERIVFLHSWNEWCEGTYLEPDGRSGRRYLEETRAAIADARAVLALSRSAEHEPGIALAHQLAQKKDKYAFRLVQAMRTQSVYANREIERLRAEVATVHLLREQISDAMTAARARADKAIEQISHEMTATQARADEAIRTVFNTVYGSTSWRVTAPLRRMSAWLRGR